MSQQRDNEPVRHAVVLAAGQGSRLRPLTDDVPKPLLPIDGVPVIERVLTQLADQRVEHARVVVGYRGEVVRRHLQQLASEREWPQLTFTDQPEQLGSAHALQSALADGLPRVDTVMAASDTWWRDEDVAAVVAAFAQHRPICALGLRRWPVEQLPHRSTCVVDAELRVTKVVEKPAAETLAAGSGLAGSPLYVFRHDLWGFVEEIEQDAHGLHELAVGLQRAIDAGHELRGVEVLDTRDLTRPADLLRFNFPYLAPYLHAAD